MNYSREIKSLTKRRLENKIDLLIKAMDGNVTNHHRFLLKEHFDHMDFISCQIAEFDEKIRQKKKNSKTLNNKKLELEKSKQEIITLEERFDTESKELKQISEKIEPLNQEVEIKW